MRAITVIGTNVVIDCETVEEAVAYMDRLAATPAPLDQRQHQCTHGHMAAQAILDAAIDVFPEEWVAADSSMAMPVTMRGRDVFALRDALKGADRE